MKLTMYQVDAFADRVFRGNPAAVCPLDSWLPDETLQSIAEENNLAETAFFVPEGSSFRLRWFTPVAEVDLCGHATLASADVLYRQMGYAKGQITFETRSGQLLVTRQDAEYRMNFPASMPEICEAPPLLIEALGATPALVLKAFDYIAIYDSKDQIANLKPDFFKMNSLALRGVVVSAPGDEEDFVSRFFAPKLGVQEDPVTGSAHCELAPYWATRVGRSALKAQQLSARGGSVGCEVIADRVILSGTTAHYMTAEIFLP
jgi:PhzF family phenazine biosynthesis protein